VSRCLASCPASSEAIAICTLLASISFLNWSAATAQMPLRHIGALRSENLKYCATGVVDRRPGNQRRVLATRCIDFTRHDDLAHREKGPTSLWRFAVGEYYSWPIPTRASWKHFLATSCLCFMIAEPKVPDFSRQSSVTSVFLHASQISPALDARGTLPTPLYGLPMRSGEDIFPGPWTCRWVVKFP